MRHVEYGQCGLCSHYGEFHEDQEIFMIRTKHEAPEDYVNDCGHPKHAELDLKVTPISGCMGFEPAAESQIQAV